MGGTWLLLAVMTGYVLAGPLSTINTAHHAGISSMFTNLMNDSNSYTKPQCLAQRQPYDIQLKPIKYQDCIIAAEKATFGGKAAAPMHFSRDPDVGMEMPAHWAHGSCMIRIDTQNPKDEDSFPMYIVANAASLIAELCTKPDQPGLGGIGLIGPKRVIMIFVYGRVPGPPPRPRPTFLPVANVA